MDAFSFARILSLEFLSEKITRRADLLRGAIDSALDADRVHEVLAEMRDVFEKHGWQIEFDVVEEHEVLVELAHVADFEFHGGEAGVIARLQFSRTCSSL